MSHGQDPQGVCCLCNPFPQCGHTCQITDVYDCAAQGGIWLGEVQGDCDACEEVCESCEQTCTDDSQCPDGYICEGGNCVLDSDGGGWGEGVIPCNIPGLEGSWNCMQVLHVKRPYQNGFPRYEDWGVAIWHKPCDSDCDGDIYDEAPVDQDGEFIRTLEDMGPIIFELATDVYDEETNEPIGKYKSGCCCPLYLIVGHCNHPSAYCIDLSDVCPDMIPEWNPEGGEVLVLRGKEGTDAEGFCGYSVYNFNLDGSQRYGPCGRPVYEWVINNGCKFGAGSSSAGGCAYPAGRAKMDGITVKFCDLDIEVFQVPEPSWLEGNNSRLCQYICGNCHAIYEQCYYCDDNHPDYPYGKCIGSHYCEFKKGSVNDNNFHFTPTYPDDTTPCNEQIPSLERDCMRRDEIITSEQFALHDYYWDMPNCGTGVYSDNPCGECNYLLLKRCNSSNCNDQYPDDQTPQWIFTIDYNEDWNNKSHLRVIEDHTYGQIAGCYENMGIVNQGQLPEGSVFSIFIESSVCYRKPDDMGGEIECRGTDACTMYSPCCQGSPNYTFLDCSNWCPSWACNREYEQGPGGTCLYCCDCESPACETQPGGNPCPCEGDYPWGGHGNAPQDDDQNNEPITMPQVNFTSLELYPSEIKVVIPIDLPTITTEIPVSFIKGTSLPLSGKPTPVDVETYNSMKPNRYVPNFVTQELGETIRTGSFADSRRGVPQINEANHLGNYTDGGEEWSAWLTVGDCHAVNSIINETRYFSFSYTVFAYCQSGDCKLDSKVIEKKVVGFYMDARIGDRS